MNKGRRIGALMLATASTAGLVALVAPTAADAAPRGPRPVSNGIQAVKANTGTWVGIRWTTDRRICDVAVRVNGRGVSVDYPGSRRFTTFARGSLWAGRTDVTSFRVDPEFRRSGVARLNATIQYDNCGRRDRTIRRSFNLAMPVIVINNGGGQHGGQQGGGQHGGQQGGGQQGGGQHGGQQGGGGPRW